MERERLLIAAEIFGATPVTDPTALPTALTAAGFSQFECDSLIALFPIPFGRIILRNSGLVDFASTLQAQTKDGAWVSIALTSQPIYNASLALADDCFAKRVHISAIAYQSICARSAELACYAEAHKAGKDIHSVEFSTALIAPSAEELGYIANGTEVPLAASSPNPAVSASPKEPEVAKKPWWKFF